MPHAFLPPTRAPMAPLFSAPPAFQLVGRLLGENPLPAESQKPISMGRRRRRGSSKHLTPTRDGGAELTGSTPVLCVHSNADRNAVLLRGSGQQLGAMNSTSPPSQPPPPPPPGPPPPETEGLGFLFLTSLLASSSLL